LIFFLNRPEFFKNPRIYFDEDSSGNEGFSEPDCFYSGENKMTKRHQNSSASSAGSARSTRRAHAETRAKPKTEQKSRTKLPELTAVTFAEDMEQAREFETLLAANGIPAAIKEPSGESAETDGIAVMVPEDYLDEAHVVIESQDAYDDFYDFTLEDEDEDEGDFDSELFEDDF
jgi:hypothetical protein